MNSDPYYLCQDVKLRKVDGFGQKYFFELKLRAQDVF